MYPHEEGITPNIAETGVLVRDFSADEVVRLVALRRRFQTHPDHIDADAAIRRLEFARWLVQHGKLTDGCDGAYLTTHPHRVPDTL